MAGNGLLRGDDGRQRCAWCARHEDYRAYHDEEWGRPITDDRLLFEKICLEGFQSGLSWLTILRKRGRFRRVFRDFEPRRVARFDGRSVERLLRDEGIVRHRGKIESTVNNARRAIELQRECGSLAAFFWGFEPRPAKRSGPLRLADVPAKTPESAALSCELKRRGWSFVGPTTAYAFMQSMGIVNDHLAGCSARTPVERARSRLRRPG